MDRSERIAAVVAEAGQVLQHGLAALHDQGRGMDLGSLELRMQQLLRRIGSARAAGRPCGGWGGGRVSWSGW